MVSIILCPAPNGKHDLESRFSSGAGFPKGYQTRHVGQTFTLGTCIPCHSFIFEISDLYPITISSRLLELIPGQARINPFVEKRDAEIILFSFRYEETRD
jgi:hypothetical protein